MTNNEAPQLPDENPLDISSSLYWSSRYQNGDNGWDLGKESAVLSSLIHHPDFPVADSIAKISLLVPGCGYGHDALWYARNGYHVTAVDFAPEAIDYVSWQAQQQHLPVTPLERDIFTLHWDLAGTFDAVVEYTCYCAIDPRRREEYVSVLASVVKPHGIVAGLFFPVDDVVRVAPPFTVFPDDVVRQFEDAGFVLCSSDIPEQSHPARAGRELLMVFRKH